METINERVLPLNNDNYELWLVRYADGELTADERASVESWLESHPDAAEELSLYSEAPRLERDESVRYAAHVVQPSRPMWPVGWRWAAAAAVALLLMVPAIRLLTPQRHPAVVSKVENPIPQQVMPEEKKPLQDLPVAPVTNNRSVQRKVMEVPEEVVLLAEAEEVALILDAVETDEPEVVVQEVVAEDVISVEEDGALSEVPLVYVNNLFVEEEPDAVEQRLLAVNDAAKGSLQGTWLGRRLARRLPDDEELLAMVDNARERTPRGIRMVAEMIIVYNESNK